MKKDSESRRITRISPFSSFRLHPSSFASSPSFLRQAQDRLFILHPLHAGFTLVEILVVLVIIGITIALIGVNLQRDGKSELREQAQRMALLLQAARSEAIGTGKSMAFIARPPNYGFYTRDEERKWTVALADPPFSQGELPTPIVLADFQINRARVPVDTPLVFSASGLNPSFRLELDYGSARMLVLGDAGGNIRASEVTEQTASAR